MKKKVQRWIPPKFHEKSVRFSGEQWEHYYKTWHRKASKALAQKPVQIEKIEVQTH